MNMGIQTSPSFDTLRIRLYVLRKGLYLHSYSKDGIGTLNPIGRGLDSYGQLGTLLETMGY